MDRLDSRIVFTVDDLESEEILNYINSSTQGCGWCFIPEDYCGYLDCPTEDRAKEIERELEGLVYGIQG